MAIFTFQEALKKTGTKPNEVKSLGLGSMPSEQPKKQGFFADAVSDLDQIGPDIRSDFGKAKEKVQGALDAGVDGKIPLTQAAAQAFALGAGGFSDILGSIFKGVTKAALPQGAEDKTKEIVKGIATPIMNSELAKEIADKYNALDEDKKREIDSVIGIGKFVSDFTGIGVAGKAAKPGVKLAVEGAEGAIDLAKKGVGAAADLAAPVLDAAGNVIKGTKDVAEMALDSAGRIPNKIAVNVAEKQAKKEAIKALPTETAKQAAKDGIEIPDINTVLKTAEAVPEQKSLAKQLIDSAKTFAKDKSKTDPIEIIGRPIVQRLKILDKAREKVGKALGEASKKLGDVTTKDLGGPVFNALKKVPGLQGITVSPKGILDFAKTTLSTSMTKSDRQAIQKAFLDSIKGGSGEQKHLLRQEIFEILGGKKKSLTNITDTQEKALNAIREGLSTVLEGKNVGYKTLSNQYRKIIQPLKDMRKSMKAIPGIAEDILDMKAGLLARRLTSLAPSGTDIRQMLRSMDSALGKKINTTLKVEELQDLYNVLDKYYDLSPGTGFQSQIKKGVEKAGGVKETIMDTVRGFAGETDAVRQKALERIFEETLK